MRGSTIVTDSATATYVLLIYRNEREFFLHWWSLPATQKAPWPKNVINYKDYLMFLSIIDYLAFTKKHNLKKNAHKRQRICSLSCEKFLNIFEAERSAS